MLLRYVVELILSLLVEWYVVLMEDFSDRLGFVSESAVCYAV